APPSATDWLKRKSAIGSRTGSRTALSQRGLLPARRGIFDDRSASAGAYPSGARLSPKRLRCVVLSPAPLDERSSHLGPASLRVRRVPGKANAKCSQVQGNRRGNDRQPRTGGLVPINVRARQALGRAGKLSQHSRY